MLLDLLPLTLPMKIYIPQPQGIFKGFLGKGATRCSMVARHMEIIDHKTSSSLSYNTVRHYGQ